jgi:hypothetical protein
MAKIGDLKGESTIVADQSQENCANHFKNTILRKEIDGKCRLCKQGETTDHLFQDVQCWIR